MPQLQPWQNFYMLLGGASATLVGLMFIAISFVSAGWTPEDRPVAGPSLSAFMSPTFIHFVYVLVTAVVVFVPTLTATTLGGLLVLTGIGSLGHIARNLPFMLSRYRRRQIDRSDLVCYSLLPSIGYLLYLDTGIGLLRASLGGTRPAHALDALAAASVLLLVIGVRNAWDLVVFMALRALEPPDGDRPQRREPPQP